MIKRLRCVMIAVRDFDTALQKYSTVLGIEPKITSFETEGVKVAFFSIGESGVELITPLKPGVPIDKFLDARGEGLFAVSLEVTDVDKDMKEMAGRGLRLLSDEPLIDEVGSRYVFSHPKSMHGVEFEITQLAG